MRTKIPNGTVMVNNWPAKCCKCGCQVDAFKGKAVKADKWTVFCQPCYAEWSGKKPAQPKQPLPAPKPVEQLDNSPKVHGNLRYGYDSWGDFMRAALGHSHLSDHDRLSRDTSYKPDWFGTKNFQEAIQLAETGWPEGMEKVRQVSQSIMDAISSTTLAMETRMDLCGDEIDVPLMLCNEPESWYNYPLVEHKGVGGRILKVAVNLAVSCGVRAQAIINRGAAALAVIDALENNGYRVELTILDCLNSYVDDSSLTNEILVKTSEQPLDLDRLSFALVHPSMFRRLMFSVLETYGEPIVRHFGFYKDSDYGTPSSIKNPQDYDIFFNKIGYLDDWESLEDSVNNALAILKKSGLLQWREAA